MTARLKIGVVGAGHLGKIHLKCIQTLSEYELGGFYDTDIATRGETAKQFETHAFDSIDALIAACDVVDIVTPTIYHFEVAQKAILAGKHIFIEKPLTHTIEEGEKLVALVKQHKLIAQVGHVERFNPAFLAVADMKFAPLFIEAHRLAPFNPRGTDVSVVLDLMIHDIDLVLHIVKSPIKEIHANGAAVVSNTPDICNVRLAFENGSFANLTASRISFKQMRKMRVFQRNAYMSLDFFEKTAQVIHLFDEETVKVLTDAERDTLLSFDNNGIKKWVRIDMPDVPTVNAIALELQTLAHSILENKPVRVTIDSAFEALKVAHRIIEAIGDTSFS